MPVFIIILLIDKNNVTTNQYLRSQVQKSNTKHTLITHVNVINQQHVQKRERLIWLCMWCRGPYMVESVHLIFNWKHVFVVLRLQIISISDTSIIKRTLNINKPWTQQRRVSNKLQVYCFIDQLMLYQTIYKSID